MHGADEVDVIHCSGYNVGARVSIGGHCAGKVNEMHQPAAEEIAQRIGVVRQNDFGHLRLRAGYSSRQRGLGKTCRGRTPCLI